MASNRANTPTAPPLDRIELWGNDDLLLTAEARAVLAAQSPEALLVLDWPDLRNLFGELDLSATNARKRRHRVGLFALSIGVIGAITTAVLPIIELLGGGFVRWTFAVAAAISTIGLVWTTFLALRDINRSQWLEGRLQTERLRQFYFQFLSANFDLASQALTDASARAALNSERVRALRIFKAWLAKPMSAELTAVIEDVNDKRVWQLIEWRAPLYMPRPGAEREATKLFELIREQRLGIQLAYIREKLTPGFGSPETRLRFLDGTSNFCTVAATILSIGTAIILFQAKSTDDLTFRVMTSLIALIGLIAIFSRAVADGLQLKANVVRYRWYRDAVADLDASFNNPDPLARYKVLRDMELLAYREMREFLDTHLQADFNL